MKPIRVGGATEREWAKIWAENTAAYVCLREECSREECLRHVRAWPGVSMVEMFEAQYAVGRLEGLTDGTAAMRAYRDVYFEKWLKGHKG